MKTNLFFRFPPFTFFFFSSLFLSCGSGNKITTPRQETLPETTTSSSEEQLNPSSENTSASRLRSRTSLDVLPENLESHDLSYWIQGPRTHLSHQNQTRAASIEDTSTCFFDSRESLWSLLPRAERITNHLEERMIPLMTGRDASSHPYFQLDEVGLLYSSDITDELASIELTGSSSSSDDSIIDTALHQCSHASHNFTSASAQFQAPLKLSVSVGQNQSINAILGQVTLSAHKSQRTRPHQIIVNTSGNLSVTQDETSSITSFARFLKHTSRLDHQVFLLQDGRLLLVLSSLGSEHVVKRMWSTYRLRILNQ